ncbi:MULTISPECIES: helix-turn-helix domain-containing protein [unclassified Lysinibacillus]|uniref:helix-turn-helix domain-containing protein n=1 Tax=unclassified Lysinibacillus TaxID=2636778 RepID=UPI00382617EE
MGKRKTYENVIQPHLKQIVEWRRQGAKLDWIAEKFGIHRSTFFRWRDKFSDLSDALKEAECDFYLTAS